MSCKIFILRITPFLPNWFINIVSPVIDVALKPFWLGTFIGVAPPSFVAIQVCQKFDLPYLREFFHQFSVVFNQPFATKTHMQTFKPFACSMFKKQQNALIVIIIPWKESSVREPDTHNLDFSSKCDQFNWVLQNGSGIIGSQIKSLESFQAGTTLQQLTSTTEALTFQSIALLVIFAFLSILPVILKNR